MKKTIVLIRNKTKKLIKTVSIGLLVIFCIITMFSCDSNVFDTAGVNKDSIPQYVNISLAVGMPSFDRNAIPNSEDYGRLKYRLTGVDSNSENEQFLGFWESLALLENANLRIHTGPWQLILTAYRTWDSDLSIENNAQNIVLQGTVDITISQSTTIPFVLKEIEDCKVNGSFEYTVYYPSSNNWAINTTILNAEDLSETDYYTYEETYESYTRIHCSDIPSGNYLLKIQFVYTIGDDSFESYTMPLIQIAAGLETKGSRTLSANEITSFYTIHYTYLEDGTMPAGYVESYTPYKAVVLENPTRQNYRFLGWYTSPEWTDENKLPVNTDGKSVLNQNHDFENDVYIYARWLRTYYEQDGFSWSLNDDVLTISGEGDVPFASFEEWRIARSAIVEEGITGFVELSWSYGHKGFSNYYDGRKLGYTDNIESIILPSTFTWICENCFYGCSSLNEIIIPEHVTIIKNNAFGGCTALEEIVIPSSVASIGDYAFCDCTNLNSITISNGVLSIGENAFRNCTSIESITIPSSVTTIRDYAFAYCTGISSIIVPATVTEQFSKNVFQGWRSNQTITLEWNSNDSSHEKPYVPYSNTFSSDVTGESLGLCYYNGTHAKYRNGVYAWNGCTLNAEGTTIIVSGEGAGCPYNYEIDLTNVTSIIVQEGITHLMRHSTPETNTSVKTVSLPSSLVELGPYVFKNFAGIEEIVIPESVAYIGYDAFNGCDSLSSINLPQNITEIRDYAFNGCSSLQEIELPGALQTIRAGAFSNSGLTSISIPSGVTLIETNAFRECSSLSTISLPATLTSIGEYAFYKCTGFTALTIPSSVTEIGSSAFDYCTNNQTITLDWNAGDTTERTIASDAFGYAGVVVKYKDGTTYGN